MDREHSPANTKTAMTLPANSGEERSWTSPVDNVILLDIIDVEVVDVSYTPVYSGILRLCEPYTAVPAWLIKCASHYNDVNFHYVTLM